MKPTIGWMPCKQRFFLDALPITTEEAVRHWREGTAKFFPNAEKRIRTLVIGSNIAWHIEQVTGGEDDYR